MGGGWTKTKLMLFSTQVEVVVELKLELSLAIKHPELLKYSFAWSQKTSTDLRLDEAK